MRSRWTWKVCWSVTIDTVAEKSPPGCRPGDAGLSCAHRELREETGAEASAWYPIGRVFANPAILTSKVHFFLAIDAALGGETHFDDSEEIETCPMPVTEVYRGLFDGTLVV